MNEQLQLLIDLQALDQKIQILAKKIVDIPLQVKELQKGKEAEQKKYEQKAQSVESIEKEKRKKERDLEGKEAFLAKLKDQLLSIKTNREYQTLLHEIEVVKEEISKLEEEVLILIEDGEVASSQLKEVKKIVREQEESIETKKQEKERELEGFIQEKEKYELQKSEHRKQIFDELLKQYNKVKEYHNGLGVVTVKDGSCQGCFMNLMPQLFQEVRQNSEIYSCPHCHRIIYYKE